SEGTSIPKASHQAAMARFLSSVVPNGDFIDLTVIECSSNAPWAQRLEKYKRLFFNDVGPAGLYDESDLPPFLRVSLDHAPYGAPLTSSSTVPSEPKSTVAFMIKRRVWPAIPSSLRRFGPALPLVAVRAGSRPIAVAVSMPVRSASVRFAPSKLAPTTV